MKRLYRDKSDVMIAGVCSGIGKYLDIDPTAIRLAFVLFTFLGGGGLWVYLVLWVIMPLKPGTDNKIVEIKEEKPAPKKVAVPKQTNTKKAAVKDKPAKKPTARKKTSKTPTVKKSATPADHVAKEKQVK